jgi:hypothetical protein
MSIEVYAERFVGSSELLASQKDYLSRKDSTKSTVDYAIRFEDVPTSLPKIFNRLGINVELEAVKVGKKGLPHVPKDVRKRVEDFYRTDYEQYGY